MFTNGLQAFRGLSIVTRRLLSTALSDGERKITDILQKQYPKAQIQVNDVSGGCGSMYQIIVHTPEFKGLLKVQQHKQLTELLKEEIKSMHGLVIETKAI